MSVDEGAMQAALLAVLSGPHSGTRITDYNREDGFYATVLSLLPDKGRNRDINAGIWALVAQRLAYLSFVMDPGSSKGIDAHLRLTEAGKRAANESNSSPDNELVYWSRFVEVVPDASSIALQYADEALRSYHLGCYLASVVMLGACSERVFLDTAESFNIALGGSPAGFQASFRKAYLNKRPNLKEMADTFHAAATENNPNIPYPIREGIDNHWQGIFHLMRVARNNAGHPTGANVTQGDVHDYLILLPHNLRRLYDLKAHCDNGGSV